MLRIMLSSWMLMISAVGFSCPDAVGTNNILFCSSFKAAATCHCRDSGLPSSMCKDMRVLYKRMVSVFGSLQRACAYQKNTNPQQCVDDWNCYLQGGKDSLGRACNSTTYACV